MSLVVCLSACSCSCSWLYVCLSVCLNLGMRFLETHVRATNRHAGAQQDCCVAQHVVECVMSWNVSCKVLCRFSCALLCDLLCELFLVMHNCANWGNQHERPCAYTTTNLHPHNQDVYWCRLYCCASSLQVATRGSAAGLDEGEALGVKGGAAKVTQVQEWVARVLHYSAEQCSDEPQSRSCQTAEGPRARDACRCAPRVQSSDWGLQSDDRQHPQPVTVPRFKHRFTY